MAEPVDVFVEATPNPNAIKFTLNRTVAAQGKTYRRPAAPSVQTGEAASAEPAWVRELLTIAGVTQVFALNNFIAVTKAPEADWEVIAPQVEQVLRQAFA